MLNIGGILARSFLQENWDITFILDGYVDIVTLRRIRVESVRLDIGGQLFQSDWESHQYIGHDEPSVKFYISFDTQRGERTACIKAIVNGESYTSDSFILTLPEKK